MTASLQLNHSQEDSSRCSDNSSYEEPLSPISASSSTSRRRQGERDLELREMELPDVHVRDLASIGHRFLPSEPSKWNVEDVYEFIRSLPGEEYSGTPPPIFLGFEVGGGGLLSVAPSPQAAKRSRKSSGRRRLTGRRCCC